MLCSGIRVELLSRRDANIPVVDKDPAWIHMMHHIKLNMMVLLYKSEYDGFTLYANLLVLKL